MILYVAKRSSYDIGSKVHLQALKDIYGHNEVFIIDLLNSQCIREERYVSYGDYRGLKNRIERWTQGNIPYISNAIINDIIDIIERYKISLIFMEESDLGNLTKRIKTVNPDAHIICFYHDISADLFAQRRRQASWTKPHYKFLDCNITIYQEKLNQKYCDENWVFHQCDKEKFERFYGYSPTALIPLASPIPRINDITKEAIVPAGKCKKLLFVCSSYYVNRMGFRWFYDNVLPGLQFDFQMNIVGTGSKNLSDFCTDGRVNLLGTVDSLAQYYLDADIVITPIFDGGGMKVKTMEAVSYGKCIVGSSESLHGFWEKMPSTIKNNIVFQCDQAREWQCALHSLAMHDTKKFNPDLFEVFLKNFSYEVLLEAFKKQLL